MANIEQRKRDSSPSSIKRIKKTRIDTLFDSQTSEGEINNLNGGIDYSSFLNQSPVVSQERRRSLFEEVDRTPTREHANRTLTSLLDDDEEEVEEEEDMFSNSNRPFRRSIYSELLLSSMIDQEENAKSNISIFEGDEETDNFESKTTLPLSRSYARPIPNYEDEVDAFFSSHNPANEPEFVLSSALTYSLLQEENRLGPPWFTYIPHSLTQEYFDKYSIEDTAIPVERPNMDDEEIKNITTLFDSKFIVIGNMGTGEFAEVWKVKCAETDQDFAMKKAKVNFTGWEDRWLKIIEVDHLRKVKDSKYCVHLVDAWEEQACLYIQLELCPNGSLEDYIKTKKEPIPEDIVWSIFYEIVMGVKDIHDANIVHLDLKPSNILIDELGCIKIGDFGVSVQTPVNIRFVKGEGDRRYMAPDLLREEFDKPADIFSLGLILLELATGAVLPGKGESWEMLRVGDFTKQKAALSKLSSEMKEMIEWLLTTKAKERPTINDIIGHSTFKNVSSIYEEYSLSKQLDELHLSQSSLCSQLKRQDSFSTIEEAF